MYNTLVKPPCTNTTVSKTPSFYVKDDRIYEKNGMSYSKYELTDMIDDVRFNVTTSDMTILIEVLFEAIEAGKHDNFEGDIHDLIKKKFGEA